MSDKYYLIKNRNARFFVIFAVAIAVFIVCSYPTRDVFSVFTVSEVRPAAVVNPMFGMFFGIPGALGCAVGNLICDAMSGYGWAILVEGFGPQFLYGILPYIIIRAMNHRHEDYFRFDRVKRVIVYVLASFINCIVIGIFVGLIIWGNFGAELLSTSFFIFLNDFVFSLLLGFPIAVLITFIARKNAKQNTKHTLCEFLLLFSAAAEAIIVIIVGMCIYNTAPDTTDIFNVWNQIYIYSAITVIIFTAVSVLFTGIITKRFGPRKSIEQLEKLLDKIDWD